MIAVPQSLPLVQWHSSRQVPLSEGWLSESIARSAQRAGYSSWEWSKEVARAITFYLQQDYQGTLISPRDLRAIIRKSLDGIGCGDIARKVSLVAPRVSIDLAEIARLSGLELIFFQMLASRLLEARHVVVQGVRLDGIRPCVKILDGSRKWDRGCQKLNDEIVTFARRHVESWNHAEVDLAVF